MAAGSFQKSSIGWQLQQLGRRGREWFELRFLQNNSDASDNLPTASGPNWLERGIVWLLVALLLIWVSWRAYKLVKAYLRNWRSRSGPGIKLGSAAAGREPTVATWRRRAEETRRQGRYGEACRALYMAMLQRLHDTQVIVHQPSRTDGEYLQLVHHFSQPRPYQVLIQTHERFCFGNLAATAETFQRCQRAYQEIAKQ